MNSSADTATSEAGGASAVQALRAACRGKAAAPTSGPGKTSQRRSEDSMLPRSTAVGDACKQPIYLNIFRGASVKTSLDCSSLNAILKSSAEALRPHTASSLTVC